MSDTTTQPSLDTSESVNTSPRRSPLWYLSRNVNFVIGMTILLVIGILPTLLGLTVDPVLHRTGSFPARQGPSGAALDGATGPRCADRVHGS